MPPRRATRTKTMPTTTTAGTPRLSPRCGASGSASSMSVFGRGTIATAGMSPVFKPWLGIAGGYWCIGSVYPACGAGSWVGAIPGTATPSIVPCLLRRSRGTGGCGSTAAASLACVGAIPGIATPIIVFWTLSGRGSAVGGGAAAAGRAVSGTRSDGMPNIVRSAGAPRGTGAAAVGSVAMLRDSGLVCDGAPPAA